MNITKCCCTVALCKMFVLTRCRTTPWWCTPHSWCTTAWVLLTPCGAARTMLGSTHRVGVRRAPRGAAPTVWYRRTALGNTHPVIVQRAPRGAARTVVVRSAPRLLGASQRCCIHHGHSLLRLLHSEMFRAHQRVLCHPREILSSCDSLTRWLLVAFFVVLFTWTVAKTKKNKKKLIWAYFFFIPAR